MNTPRYSNARMNEERAIVRELCLAMASLLALVLVLALTGCGTLHTEYHAVTFSPPGSTNVASRIDGTLTRRALGLRSSIPQFRVGPTNGAVIETSGSLETSGDAAYLKAAIQGIINGVK